MSEQQKQPVAVQEPSQSQEQLQALKETIKENKILQSKNTKLEAKYVELFKEQKAVKKDHSVFLAFLSKLFNGEGNAETGKQAFQEAPVGQYQLAYLEKLAYEKESAAKKQIEDLTSLLYQRENDQKSELQRTVKEKNEELVAQFEAKMKKIKEQSNKEMNGYLKELQQFKRLAKNQSDELNELRSTLQLKNNQLSKMSKEKLKLQHHLNNIRKKEIAEELNPQRQKEQEKIMTERNEFLSLRQQVESLMGKRDELKRLLKEKEAQLAAERKKNQQLQQQLTQLKQFQREQDEKYELIRQCSLQELQNLILSHHFDAPVNDTKLNSQPAFQVPKKPLIGEDSDQIQKQYLKNIMTRYIKAETSGAFDQALTLLQVIGTILKLDPSSSLALQQYKSKRKQWWYIKY